MGFARWVGMPGPQGWVVCWEAMRLMAPVGKGKRSGGARLVGAGLAGAKGSGARALTTAPGFVNPNHQEVVERTGFGSTSFAGQVIYRMRCRGCSMEYGANGCDIHARRCPGCQEGVAGEPLRERSVGLFG